MESAEKPRRGRPPKGEGRQSIGIMLEPRTIAALSDLAAWTGKSRNDAVNEAVTRYHRSEQKKRGRGEML